MNVKRTLFALMVGLAVCGSCKNDTPAVSARPVPAARPAPTPAPAPRSTLRFAMRNHIVDGDGAIVATIAGVDARSKASPVGGDHYWLDRWMIDAHDATTVPLPAIYNPMEGNYAIGDGFVIASPLSGGLERVDVPSGAVRWKVPASGTSLAIVGDEVDATEGTGNGVRTVGYALADGTKRFESSVHPPYEDTVVEAGHVLVLHDPVHTAIDDLAGHRWLDAHSQIMALAKVADDFILVTNGELIGVRPDGAIRWRRTISWDYDYGTSVTALPGGDAIVAQWSPMADSGIQLWRIRMRDGHVAWHVDLPGIGVGHSKYSNETYVAVRGDKLFAISQASGGDFFERIDLATGWRERRCQPLGTCWSPIDRDAAAPFVVGNRLMASDGRVLQAIAGVDNWQIAQPLGNHVFAVGGYQVYPQLDRDTALSVRVFPRAELRRVDSDHDRNEVVAYAAEGSVAWRHPLDGVRSVRPPDLAVTDSTVIAAVMGTLRAFDRSTGRTLWSAHADADNVVMAGDTVYYVTCNDPTHDHWLYARSLADGSVRFRATLVDACDSRLAVDAHHEIAIDEGHGEESELSIAFDHAGHELYRLREQIAATHTQDDDLVIVSDKRIARLADTGRVVWSLPAPHDSFVTAAEFAELPDGDLVVATYCAISDNGIELQRIGEDGSVRWHVTVPGLGVQHSEYLQHVYLEIRKQSLFAVSQASGGNFIEQLDLATGAHHAVLRP